MKNTCKIKTYNPLLLTDKDFDRLNEITQEMWAHGIGEFVQCKCCNKMMSKKDIFGHLSKGVYDETVRKIMQTLNYNDIDCISCGGKTKFVYGEDNIINIKDRLLKSKNSFLVTALDDNGEIVGYMDGYTDSLDGIFNREYKSHYLNIGIDEIKNRVQNVLGYVPNEMLVFSGIGLIEKYSNFFNIFLLLKNFFESVKNIPENTPGISELDKNNHLFKLFSIIGYLSLNIDEDEKLSKLIANKSDNYRSEMVVHPNPIKTIKSGYCVGVKELLRNDRKNQRLLECV